MTREEQIRHEAGSLADFAIAHGAPWKEYHKGFIDGAKWQREQVMKEAVEAYVNTYEPQMGNMSYVEFVTDIPSSKFGKCDKVKIIIVKQEE